MGITDIRHTHSFFLSPISDFVQLICSEDGKKHARAFSRMTEYVYALHDFLPEHEDEVSFRMGERIEVIEKDDLYGDGWWQVCLIP